MSSYTALLDANVLYPAPVRDLFLQLAVTDVYKARWTAGIHREWIENLLENEPHRDRAKLERTRELMDGNTRDALGPTQYLLRSRIVAHALLRAASRLFSTPLRMAAKRRHECRRGTQECVRHTGRRRNVKLFLRNPLVMGYESLIPSLQLPDPNDRHVLAAAVVGRCDVIVTANLTDFPNAVLAPFGIEAQHPDEFLCNHLNLAQGLFCRCVQKIRSRLKNPPRSTGDYLETLTRSGLVATAAELRPFAELL